MTYKEQWKRDLYVVCHRCGMMTMHESDTECPQECPTCGQSFVEDCTVKTPNRSSEHKSADHDFNHSEGAEQ